MATKKATAAKVTARLQRKGMSKAEAQAAGRKFAANMGRGKTRR